MIVTLCFFNQVHTWPYTESKRLECSCDDVLFLCMTSLRCQLHKSAVLPTKLAANVVAKHIIHYAATLYILHILHSLVEFFIDL